MKEEEAEDDEKEECKGGEDMGGKRIMKWILREEELSGVVGEKEEEAKDDEMEVCNEGEDREEGKEVDGKEISRREVMKDEEEIKSYWYRKKMYWRRKWRN